MVWHTEDESETSGGGIVSCDALTWIRTMRGAVICDCAAPAINCLSEKAVSSDQVASSTRRQPAGSVGVFVGADKVTEKVSFSRGRKACPRNARLQRFFRGDKDPSQQEVELDRTGRWSENKDLCCRAATKSARPTPSSLSLCVRAENFGSLSNRLLCC